MGFLIAFAAATLVTSMAAQPEAPAAATRAPATVTVAFAPPLDRPIRYRATRTRTHNGTTNGAWVDHELRFLSRAGGGFRLSVRTLAMGRPGERASAAAGLMVSRVAPPYVLLLDAKGNIEGLENEEAYFTAMYAGIADMLRAERRARGQPVDERALQVALDMFRRTPRETQIATLTLLVSPVLEYAGLEEATLGESISGENEVAGIGTGPGTQRFAITPTRVDNGHLFVTMRSTLPREEASRLVRNMLAQVPVTGQGQNTQESRARTEAQLRDMDYSDVTEASYEVSLTTGLALRSRRERRIEVRTPRETQTTIERIELEPSS